MRRCLALLVLIALVCAVFPANAARAENPPEEAMLPYVGPPNYYAPYAPEEDLVAALGLNPTGPELKRFRPLNNLVHQHPLYCVSHHNSVGCGSLKAECVFIFGGCRQFYGEPCFKGPNPYPHPFLKRGGVDGRGCAGCGD